MIDFEIIQARCPYRAGGSICLFPKSTCGLCRAVECKLTEKQVNEIILGNTVVFIPYIDM